MTDQSSIVRSVRSVIDKSLRSEKLVRQPFRFLLPQEHPGIMSSIAFVNLTPEYMMTLFQQPCGVPIRPVTNKDTYRFTSQVYFR